MATPRRTAAVVLAAAMASMATTCGSDTPATPRSVDLALDYAGPTGIVVPPSTDVSCPQLWAPVNLQVSTDWVVSVPLTAGANGHSSVTLHDVPAGAHWMVLYDVRLCPLDPQAPPIATTGIRLSGVVLNRLTTTPGGTKAVAFTVDAFGGVRP